jgi:hypothetical protein
MVRRCEIVGGASRFLVATHPTNDVIWAHGFPLFNDMSMGQKSQAKLWFDRPNFFIQFDISIALLI